MQGTHGDAVVIGVSDHLVLDLLPTFEGFVYKDLRGVSEGRHYQGDEFFSVVGKSGAQTAESERRANQDGESQALCSSNRLEEKFKVT